MPLLAPVTTATLPIIARDYRVAFRGPSERGSSVFQLSACADTLYLELPFLERCKRLAAAGFLVEFWRWPEREADLGAIADDPAIMISAFTGYLGGCIVDPEGADAFVEGCRESLPVAKQLACETLFLSSGELDANGQVIHPIARHPARRWISAYNTLSRAAELAEEAGVTYVLEHLNTKVDHPGFPLNHVEDAAELVTAVGSPRLRLLLDVYHRQIEEGDVTQAIRDYGPLLGHIHVADVPGRHEPGTGEINYPHLAAALQDVGYRGVVGLEAFPAGSTEDALARFREVFG
jgi:hydroxypyruvate isomerase